MILVLVVDLNDPFHLEQLASRAAEPHSPLTPTA
jgi:hypothetical protein